MIHRRNVVLVERDAMMVFARHATAYWSQKRPSNGQDGDCRDSEKLLCNKFPLKHEARKRERGEMLYENVSN